MNRNKNNFRWIWLVFIAFFVIGDISYAWIPLLIILAVVIGIAASAVHSAQKEDRNNAGNRRQASYHSWRPEDFTSADMAKISVYLRRFFRHGTRLAVSNAELRLHDSSFSSLSSLDVYQNGNYICSINDFSQRYPEEYKEILTELRQRADHPQEEDVFDVEAEEHKEEEKPAEKPKENTAQTFIDEINALNQDIPDEEISNGLYETTALLKQIQTLEKKLPNSKDKLTKLYQYYLPILTNILHQYANLQTATMDENYERTKKKLTDTIHLINDAMKNIISSMADSDFINLSADISTLEALLRKDGLTDENRMDIHNGGGNE